MVLTTDISNIPAIPGLLISLALVLVLVILWQRNEVKFRKEQRLRKQDHERMLYAEYDVALIRGVFYDTFEAYKELTPTQRKELQK